MYGVPTVYSGGGITSGVLSGAYYAPSIFEVSSLGSEYVNIGGIYTNGVTYDLYIKRIDNSIYIYAAFDDEEDEYTKFVLGNQQYNGLP